MYVICHIYCCKMAPAGAPIQQDVCVLADNCPAICWAARGNATKYAPNSILSFICWPFHKHMICTINSKKKSYWKSYNWWDGFVAVLCSSHQQLVNPANPAKTFNLCVSVRYSVVFHWPAEQNHHSFIFNKPVLTQFPVKHQQEHLRGSPLIQMEQNQMLRSQLYPVFLWLLDSSFFFFFFLQGGVVIPPKNAKQRRHLNPLLVRLCTETVLVHWLQLSSFLCDQMSGVNMICWASL